MKKNNFLNDDIDILSTLPTDEDIASLNQNMIII